MKARPSPSPVCSPRRALALASALLFAASLTHAEGIQLRPEADLPGADPRLPVGLAADGALFARSEEGSIALVWSGRGARELEVLTRLEFPDPRAQQAYELAPHLARCLLSGRRDRIALPAPEGQGVLVQPLPRGEPLRLELDRPLAGLAFVDSALWILEAEVDEPPNRRAQAPNRRAQPRQPGFRLLRLDERGEVTASHEDLEERAMGGLCLDPRGLRAALRVEPRQGAQAVAPDALLVFDLSARALQPPLRLGPLRIRDTSRIRWDPAGSALFLGEEPRAGHEEEGAALVRLELSGERGAASGIPDLDLIAVLDADHLAVRLPTEDRGAILRRSDERVLLLPRGCYVLDGRGDQLALLWRIEEGFRVELARWR